MIQLSNISKKFGETQAARGISLMIPDGSVFGLLGSNGAGKSTLLRMMAVILSILVYTFFSRMFDLMLPPVAKHSIVVA